MIGAEQNSALGNASGLIRAVVPIETVCTYQNSDQIININISAIDYINKEIVLRTIGNFGTYILRLAQQLTIKDIDLLTNGQSILLKLEQKDGLGNAILVLEDSLLNVLVVYNLAPSGTYIITRTAETIGANVGYNIVCLNDGSTQGFSVSSGLVGRQVGFGVYDVTGNGLLLSPQILIPNPFANDTQEVVIINNGGTCVVSSTTNDTIYGSLGSGIKYNAPQGISRFKYYNSKIYTI